MTECWSFVLVPCSARSRNFTTILRAECRWCSANSKSSRIHVTCSVTKKSWACKRRRCASDKTSVSDKVEDLAQKRTKISRNFCFSCSPLLPIMRESYTKINTRDLRCNKVDSSAHDSANSISSDSIKSDERWTSKNILHSTCRYSARSTSTSSNFSSYFYVTTLHAS